MNKLVHAFAKFRGGVGVAHNKNTAEMATIEIPAPATVIIPMQEHIGAPCKPIVKAKDTVTIGQVIADAEAFVTAPIHAPISGKVKKIQSLLMSNGQTCDAILIENDELNTISPEVQPPVYQTKQEFLQAVRASGIVGIGGAGFPLHVKLAFDQEKTPIDTLIINGAECEPYITSDYRESIEFPERVVAGVQRVMKQLGIQQGIIGMEDNKPKGIQALTEALGKPEYADTNIQIMELKTRYPQGAEKMLIVAATGRQVPTGKLPSDVGCVVMNISTVSLLEKYMTTGMPLIQKRVTVDGDDVQEPKNVLVPIGTKISEVLDFCGGFAAEPAKIILGGPMMGVAQYSTDLPITKQTNAILAFGEDHATLPQESPCIRCGRCVAACPMSLMPVQIERYAKDKNYEMLSKLNVQACMECGCCSYSCPSGRRLVQYMKQAKVLDRRHQNG